MFKIQDWGLIPYIESSERQKNISQNILANREQNNNSVFVLCEHPSVITIGKSGSLDNILFDEETLNSKNIQLSYTNRGGDVTLHNPKQLIGYPIFDLTYYKTDLHWFLREIEECIIEVIAEYGLKGGRVEGLTGVWLENKRKICAIGLHCSRWITSHGFALNVNNDLSEFENIIPCGIKEKQVTSLEKELNYTIDMIELKSKILSVFKKHFV